MTPRCHDAAEGRPRKETPARIVLNPRGQPRYRDAYSTARVYFGQGRPHGRLRRPPGSWPASARFEDADRRARAAGVAVAFGVGTVAEQEAAEAERQDAAGEFRARAKWLASCCC